ncbi:hypothetical protein QYE76_015631 [Lolium multiflorum]|uniref:Transposase (putative) gypsy type domain-containing protein n=1 Tax=Lolium multiflorum TaxID=4521 RepID=A0AAD8U6X6_LOLMU|nr:hypothetical protein QYE76_015631 [Lolium multiflorum]
MMACPARGTIAPQCPALTEDEVSVDFGNPDYPIRWRLRLADEFWLEWNFSSGSGLLRAGVSAASGPTPDLNGLTPGLAVGSLRRSKSGRRGHDRHVEANCPPRSAINAVGEASRRPLAHFFFLALLLPSLSARSSSPLLRRTSSAGELRRANLHRSAATSPVRRHGAARLDGASSAAAVAAAVARFFLAVPPLLVIFFFGLVDGVPQRIMEGLLHARGRHRAPGAPPANPAVGDHAGARRELEPQPEPGERVVFGAHLDRGLGLPASTFFRRFLDHFGLQPHHLPANACVLLSCYVAFMEAYAGLWPDIDFWSRLFFLKAQTTEGRLRACGAASIYTRPVGRINWSHNARSTDPNAEVNLLWDFLATATDGGLTAEDLLCTIAERRVLPLQMRSHKIGHMSGRFDPNRTSKAPLNKAQVASRVNHITKANLTESWSYGLVPCDREHPPARLFERQSAEDGDLATKRWTPDHVDPADQAGEHAGDDDLPQAPDLGGQGEHNPPPSAAGGGGGAGDVRHGAHPCRAPACEAAKHHGDFGAQGHEASRLHRRLGGEGEEAAPAAAEDGPGEVRLCATRDRNWSRRGCAAHDRGRGQAERGGAGRKPGGTSGAGDDWAGWAICCARSDAATAADDGGAGRQEPARDEPAHGGRRLARVGEDGNPNGVTARPARGQGRTSSSVPSASDSSLGSAATMEQAWLRADSYEVTSREGITGQASVEMFFSGLQANLKARAAEAAADVAKVEEAGKAVADRRTALYNRAVTHYHKAKLDRAALARELEAAKADAARVPQLESDLRVVRAQCITSEEANRAAAAKLQVADGELKRLRQLEANHLKELAALKKDGEEKLAELSRRLDEVERQRLALQEEVTTKSTELAATAKRWTEGIGALDRGLSGECLYVSSPLPAFGCRPRYLRPSAAMERAPDRFLDWKESATRAGADMALSFVLSWYNEVDLGQLEFRRAGAEDKLPADLKAARLARASTIAEFVDKTLFVADPNPPPSDGEYMDDEEAEDVPEDDPAAGSADAPPA